MNERAKFHVCNSEQESRIEDVRACFSDLYDIIGKLCKGSRETSLALTKLEEAQFWAIKGITREDINEK